MTEILKKKYDIYVHKDRIYDRRGPFRSYTSVLCRIVVKRIRRSNVERTCTKSIRD